MRLIKPSLLSLSLVCLGLASVSQSSHVKTHGDNICVVKANGHCKDDVPNIMRAFEKCGNGGTIVFPEDQTYWIASRLNPILGDAVIHWQGTWKFSDDLNYWRNNAYPIEFQNHAVGFVITGRNITIDGYGTGGIDGNGNAWYTAASAPNQPAWRRRVCTTQKRSRRSSFANRLAHSVSGEEYIA